MAELLTSHDQPSNLRKLILIGLVLALVAAAAFGIFYKRENHPPVQAEVTRVLPLPFHAKYGHVEGNAGADQTEDVLYVVVALSVHDRSDVPLFLKDITGSITLQDGRENPGRLIAVGDYPRLEKLVPGITPLLQQTGVPPLSVEQKVDANATRDGYVVFLYSMPPAEWDKRQSASIRLDFYHQDSVTISLPR